MKQAIIVDLDGTLCDCSHRVHHAQNKQWDEFNAGIPEDKINPAVKWLCLQAAQNELEVILCTGRNEGNRAATLRWLLDQNCLLFTDVLLMRPKDDHTPDHELKLRLIGEHFGSIEAAREKVLFTLDDRDRVVEAWRNAGFQCWQVQAGSY